VVTGARPKLGRLETMRTRFEAKIAKAPDGCWLWMGAHNSRGYGRFKIKGRLECAHRVAWTIYRGPIPKGMQVLHRCDQPRCCNPEHLFLGTHMTNVIDALQKGRTAKMKLTADDVAVIRQTPRSITHVELARRLGVGAQTIADARAGRTWRHLMD
jgi:HNH endonuclease